MDMPEVYRLFEKFPVGTPIKRPINGVVTGRSIVEGRTSELRAIITVATKEGFSYPYIGEGVNDPVINKPPRRNV